MTILHASLVALIVGTALYVAALVFDHVAGERWWSK